MHRLAQFTALTILGLALAQSAHAGLYRWTDESGTVHFTDDILLVPAEHRPTATDRQGGGRLQRYSTTETAVSVHALLSRAMASPIRIPIQREGGLIRVRVRLNETIEAPFYLDTGASEIVLPQSLADQLGFQARPGQPLVQVTTVGGSLALHTMELRSVQVGSAVVPDLRAIVSPTLDVGLLGASFFGDLPYSIDPSENVLILNP
jgi:clan AA aspartic protease (TIGR02281 family)